ncbi:protein HGH1 homolog [Ctenocephalides felis]|uniref:protein HGH1 homolog n=1 Tax=Ctenocephalides felis TaxID=7515 RepID=UPI000E6E421C|nr:protein HGH1 homolog [Ctenocephalides felis]
MESLKEILQFLDINARLDLKQVALTHVLSLTGSPEGLSLITSLKELLLALLKLTNDPSDVIAKDAALCLINISASENGSVCLMETMKHDLVDQGLKNILNNDSKLADPFCMILNNISRKPAQAQEIIDLMCKSTDDENECSEIYFHNIEKLMKCYTDVNYNKFAKLHYLGALFSNLTQCPMGRAVFIREDKFLLESLLPFISFEGSFIRRGGAIGLLKNLCFDKSIHKILLGQSSHIDILPYILLPLAGPEEFDEEDNDKLPIQLQYLGPDKKREEDPTLRVMLLECLEQLCSTRDIRNILRDRGTYEILREYHKWETKQVSLKLGDKASLLACENVVDILIRTEEEIGTDDLKSLEIPSDLVEKFNNMDKEFLEDK